MENAEVYRELRYELVRFATALVGPSDAEDVVSTVVARVLSRPGGLVALEDPRAYLMKAVVNESKSRYRARTRRAEEPLDDLADSPVLDQHDELLDLVKSLPPQQRAALFLVYWEGHTAASAGELMGCRPATVRRYLHLARKRMESELDG